MKRLLVLEEIEPVRLARAREAVVRVHFGTAAAPAALPSDVLQRLRQRMAAADGNERALDALAYELTPRELRGLVTGLEQWEDLRPATAHVLLTAARPNLVAPLWRGWQAFPLLPELREVLLQVSDRFGWKEATGPAYADPAREWVASEQPGTAIQRWLDKLNLSYSDCEGLIGAPFTSDTPVLRLVRDAVMTHGSIAQLRVEGAERLHAWKDELSPESRVLFGRNYLISTPTKNWYRPIAEWIERSYGVPQRPRVPSFWEGVPEPVKKAFQQLFIRKWIREIFRSDKDRRDYWERWADRMEYVVRGEVERTEYGVLDFGSFGVVEFFEDGNAAYFYPEQMLKRIRERVVTEKNDLREVYYAPFEYRASNRFIHKPKPRGWYDRADKKVSRWLHKTREQRKS